MAYNDPLNWDKWRSFRIDSVNEQREKVEEKKLNEIKTYTTGNGTRVAEGKYIEGNVQTSSNPNVGGERYLSIGVSNTDTNKDWIKGSKKMDYDEKREWNATSDIIMKEFAKVIDKADKEIDKIVKKYMK